MASSGLYRKPFIMAAVFLVLGAGMIAAGSTLAERTGSMGYYALIAFGVLALIIAFTVNLMYRRLEKEFQNTLRAEPVLRFTVDKSLLAASIERSVKEVKSDNKAKLLIMLVFCALVAIALPFFFEDGYLFLFIGIGMAVFLTAAAAIITAYRIGKLRNGHREFILSANGAYALGEFHCWNMPGMRLTRAEYSPPAWEEPGLIEIEYMVASFPATAAQKIRIPVPCDQTARAAEVMRKLDQRQRGSKAPA